MELSKMDGAITLSRDMKKIMSCNVLLTPNSKISTSETGTRHKAAERTAKMTGTLVIAVSERKNEINIYYKNIKYHLKNSEEVMRKTQFTLHMLEKQRELFDSNLKRLTEYELQNHPNLEQVCKVIQNGEQMRRMFESLEQNVIELGNEGKTIKSRLREIMKNVGDELMLVIKDYTKLNTRKTQNLLDALTFEEILDDINILTALAQKEANAPESIKGWRILSKTGITEQESSLLIRELGNLQNILKESDERYEQIVGAEKMRIFARAATKLRNDAKIEG
jgi:diadenylate cyclase